MEVLCSSRLLASSAILNTGLMLRSSQAVVGAVARIVVLSFDILKEKV